MHVLFERQLAKLGIDAEAPVLDAASWKALCDRVSGTYATADQERYLMERSMSLASDEMRELYTHLQAVAEQRYLDLFESANDVVFTLDLGGRFLSVNRACEEASGYRRDELVGRPWDLLFEGEDEGVLADALSGGLAGQAGARFEADLISRGGRRVPFEISARTMARGDSPRDAEAVEILGVARDIGERRMHEAHLEYLARHDALTGLANRAVLEDALVALLADPATDTDTVALGLLDLDEFKLINDTLGHAAGDRVLVTVANVLRVCLPDAVVVRLSGDEFAFILRAASASQAVEAAERVRQGLEYADIRIGGDRVFIGASIGLVRVERSSHPGGLLAEADAAMYTAKDQGRNRVHWSGSQDALTGRLAEVYRWAATLREALGAGRMEVHYQPIYALSTDARTRDTLGHFEALIRMRDEDGGLVSPMAFLPAAERFGLMPVIDRFVIDVVLQQLRSTPDVRIFVNLSAMTLADRDLLVDLTAALRREPALGARIGFEITESAALRDTALARKWIEDLAAFGSEFALDDFGTGFNSLTYVRQLPVTQIKIDGSFIHALAIDPKQRAVVAAVKVLADGLGMDTVAECIESTTTLDAVRSLGVTFGQGYLLGRPAPGLAHASSAEDSAAA